MVDKALGPPLATDAGTDWRVGLTQWALGARAGYQRHPWALRVPISGPPLGPNNIGWLEAALRCLTHPPPSEGEKVSSVILLSGFVRNEATLRADIAAASGEPLKLTYGEMLTRLTDAEHYPASTGSYPPVRSTMTTTQTATSTTALPVYSTASRPSSEPVAPNGVEAEPHDAMPHFVRRLTGLDPTDRTFKDAYTEQLKALLGPLGARRGSRGASRDFDSEEARRDESDQSSVLARTS
jgi:Tetracyclin repressor-like, C-terminal domain